VQDAFRHSLELVHIAPVDFRLAHTPDGLLVVAVQ
jgi:hypothetical protein